MFSKILVAYSEKITPQHLDTVDKVTRLLDGNRVTVVRSLRLSRAHFRETELVVTIGGDGVFIRAAGFIDKAHILGINSEPEFSEGALTSIRDTELEFLPALLQGEFKTITRRRARVTRNGRRLKYPALNEVYVGSRYQFHTSRYIIAYRDKREEQRSSGVLVVTGSGSRAWYRASGGAPFSRRAGKLKFLVREPHLGRVFQSTLLSGEIPDGEQIFFTGRRTEGGIIALDACRIYGFNLGDQVEVTLSDRPLRVIVPEERKNNR